MKVILLQSIYKHGVAGEEEFLAAREAAGEGEMVDIVNMEIVEEIEEIEVEVAEGVIEEAQVTVEELTEDSEE